MVQQRGGQTLVHSKPTELDYETYTKIKIKNKKTNLLNLADCPKNWLVLSGNDQHPARPDASANLPWFWSAAQVLSVYEIDHPEVWSRKNNATGNSHQGGMKKTSNRSVPKIFNTAGFFWFVTPAFLDLRKLQTASWRFGPFRTGFVETEPRTTAAGKSTLIGTATIRCSSRNSKLVADGFFVLGCCAGIEILRLTLEIYDFLTTLTARGTDVRWKTNTFSHRKGLSCPSPKFHSFIRNLYLGHPIWTQADVSTTQFRFVASSTIWHLISIPVFPPRQAQWTFHDSGFIPLEMFKSMKPQTALAKFTALSMLL